MLLGEVASVSATVANTAARKAKIDALAVALQSMGASEVAIGAAYLAGQIPQGSIGVGFAALRSLPDPAAAASLTVPEVDAALDDIAKMSGAGSAARRSEALRRLFAAATQEEQRFLAALLSGGVRQGAQERIVIDAVARAFAQSLADVRRAVMFSGVLGEVAAAARSNAANWLDAFGLRLFRPVQPMLAKTADSVSAGLEKLGTAIVERKLDGVRVQVHRLGDEVRAFTRNLKDITARVPEVVSVVQSLDAEPLVLDGETIALRSNGRPHPFQVTMGRFGTGSGESSMELSTFFFDVLHVGGDDVADLVAGERLERLDAVVPGEFRIPRIVTAELTEAEKFLSETIDSGHEGVMMKALDAPYQAGRRGAGWLKVKPAHTLDLVVLGVEWGSGRRQGWLSNIHLGARDPQGGFVMLGKTFKGMTDEMLAWQTKRFSDLETSREGRVVWVRPEQVVEIAFDGVQSSSRYPGGVALRFARVKGYRLDKSAEEADTIETVLDIHKRQSE